MLIFVICINLTITILNLALAWNIWRSRRSLRKLARTLRRTEVNIQQSLENAPYVIALGQVNLRHFRQSTQRWHDQWGKLQQLLSVVVWANQLHRRQQRYPSGNRPPVPNQPL